MVAEEHEFDNEDNNSYDDEMEYDQEADDQNQFEEEQVYVKDEEMPKHLVESVHKRVSHAENNEINEQDFI